jgi:enoyl-CoA hydratase/carnithine racemase
MKAGKVHVDFDNAVARVTIDRPGSKNAVDLGMMRDLGSAMREAEERRCRVLVIGAAGEDFSIGRDHYQSPLADPPGSTNQEWVGSAGGAFEALIGFTGISVASVRGIAFGFGCAVATSADICIAADTARFAFDEVPKGFPPKLVMGGLTGRINARLLLDLVSTGRSVDAQEALRIGIATRVVGGLSLEMAVKELTDTLLRNDEAAVRESKRFIKELAAMDSSARAQHSITARALT